MGSAAHVLIVEDDSTIRNLLAHALRSDGHEVRAAATAQESLLVCNDWRPDLALLDVRLGDGMDGLSLAGRLRAQGNVRLMFVSGAVSPEDIEAGFGAGADIYVEKPFEVERLLARVRSLLARGQAQRRGKWQISDMTVDTETRQVVRNGQLLDLPPREFDLLCALARRPGRVLTKDELLAEVWGYGDYDHNVVERRICALRHKLESCGPRLVKTIRGCGYTLRV